MVAVEEQSQAFSLNSLFKSYWSFTESKKNAD